METQTQNPSAVQTEQTQSQDLPVREKQNVREAGTYSGPYFEPAVDIVETPDALVLTADLPGVVAEDIETDLRESLLTITARTRPVQGQWKLAYGEYQVGHYLRQFRLGQQIDQAKISAQFRDGVLTLTLPKADHARPRKIQIQTA